MQPLARVQTPHVVSGAAHEGVFASHQSRKNATPKRTVSPKITWPIPIVTRANNSYGYVVDAVGACTPIDRINENSGLYPSLYLLDEPRPFRPKQLAKEKWPRPMKRCNWLTEMRRSFQERDVEQGRDTQQRRRVQQGRPRGWMCQGMHLWPICAWSPGEWGVSIVLCVAVLIIVGVSVAVKHMHKGQS